MGIKDASSDQTRSDHALLHVALNTKLLRVISALRCLYKTYFQRSLVTYLSESSLNQAMKKYYLT